MRKNGLPSMKILVTGATGFLGSHLTRLLVQTGHQVRVLRRATSPTRLIDDLELETAIGDVTDAAAVGRAIAGCEAVFHVAGLVSFWNGDRAALHAVNVLGTRNVVEACLSHRVKRLIHTSSISAIGFAPDGRPGDENIPYNWSRLPYCDSKRGGEEEVRKGIARGLDAVILNPGVIFGPGDLHFHSGAMVLQMAKGRIRFWFDGGCCTCDVGDVAAAHLAALSKGRSGERYILGGENFSWRALLQLIAETTGVPAPSRRISTPVLKLVAAGYRLKGLLTGRRPPITPEAIRISSVPVYFSSEKAKRELGYRASPFRESVKKTFEWYRDHGCLEK